MRLRRRALGYCVEGPNFYVWDEDPREVSRLARDLARGVGCESSAQRLPVEPENENRGARHRELRGSGPGGSITG